MYVPIELITFALETEKQLSYKFLYLQHQGRFPNIQIHPMHPPDKMEQN